MTILEKIDLCIKRGAAAAFVGISGSGKSTLLGLLAGLDTPTAGRAWLDGQLLNAMDEEQRARLRLRRVGFVFQSFHLLPGLTALENVLLPLDLAQQEGARQAAEEALAEVGLVARMAHYPGQLSGGEQQRVAIARAFAARPAILFADEPTGNLDVRTGARIADLLLGLNEARGTTLVMVTHDDGLARRCTQRFELSAGRLVHNGGGQ